MAPIFVFDLDETLIASNKEYRKAEHKYYVEAMDVNITLLGIIHRAIALRNAKKLRYVVLLTNNTNVPSVYKDRQIPFLELAFERILEEYNRYFSPKLRTIHELFDGIITAETNVNRVAQQVPNSRNPGAYRSRPVKNMDILKRAIPDIRPEDIYFFDDEQIPHDLHGQIPAGHYIQNPPYVANEYLNPIFGLLNSLEDQRRGGNRKGISRKGNRKGNHKGNRKTRRR